MAFKFPIEIKHASGVVEVAETWYGTHRVLVDGVKVRKAGAGKWAIPLTNGKEQVVIVAGVPGFPKVISGSQVIYQTPFPSGWDAVAAFSPLASIAIEPFSGIAIGFIAMGINMRNLRREDWTRTEKYLISAVVTFVAMSLMVTIFAVLKYYECRASGSC